MREREQQRFCPFCEVSMALHDGPDSCDVAERKARLITNFNFLLGGGHG